MSGSSVPSAVVDTNVFVSGMLYADGRPGRILDLWHAGRFVLNLSDQQRLELAEIFGRPRIVEKYQVAQSRLIQLFAGLDDAMPVVPSTNLPLVVRDPKDEHILAAAIGGASDYLVTGDQDLLVLQGDPRLGDLRIVTAAQFLAVLEGSENHSRATL